MLGRLKRKTFIGLSLLMAVVFFIGAIFFLSNPFELSSTQFVLFGSLTVLVGAMSSSYAFPHQWIFSFGIIAIGIYLVLRGTDWIDLPWLTWLVGIAFALAASTLCFFAANEFSEKK